MNVSLKCFANLTKEGVCDYRTPMTHTLPEGARVTDLITRLGYHDEDVKLVYVNHHIVPRDTMLHDGDRIALAPPSGGM